MGRFDDVTAPTTGRFDTVLPTGRFDAIKPEEKSLLSKAATKIGGAIGTAGHILSAGQQATTGLAEMGLEKAGVLKDTGAGPIKAVREQRSNIGLLKRIGEETGKGGVLTGQYEPSKSVFGNFINEVPVTTIGTIADIYADPLFVLGKAGKIKAATGKAGEAIKHGFTKISDEVPAVQKIGHLLGRAFVTRFGQREAFKDVDIARKINEGLAQEKVGKLVADVIEKPAVIQQRIAQVIKGGITNDDELKILAQPIREELDRVGKSISDLNPKLLNPDVFDAHKGTYFPRLYTDKEFPNPEDVVDMAFSSRAVGVPKDPFKARLSDFEFARKIKPELVDTESKIVQINESIADMVGNRLGKVKELNKTINDLEKSGLRLSLRKPEKQAFEELSAVLEHRTGSYFRKTGEVTDNTLRPTFTQVPVDRYKYYQPSLEGRELKKNIERLIFLPDAEIEKIHNAIGKTNTKVGDVFDEIRTIRKSFNEKVSKLPSLNEIKLLAEQARKNMGKIEEAGYPALKRLTQLNITESRQGFFKEAAKLASDEARPGWVQMSDDKALGELAGKFLPTAEYSAIARLRRVPTKAEEIYGNALSLWKTFKTAYNPSTIARNDLTNYFVLNPLGGVGPHRLDIYARSTNEMLTNGPLYQMARKEGLNISTQEAAELTQKATRFYKENDGLVKQFFGKVGDFHQMVRGFYGSQDKFFKFSNFVKGVTEDGLTPTQAMRRANFYLVDYSEVPELVDWLRKSPIGIPFISFTYGVSKPLAKTLLERPDKLSAYYKILNGIQGMNPMGETPQELERENDVLPDWISHGTFLRLPFKDKINRSQYVDLQYILPTNVIEGTGLTPSSPVFNWISAYVQNQDPFFKKKIWEDTDTDVEKAQKYAGYVLRQFVPSLTPFVGTSYEKIKNYFQGRPDRTGFVKDSWQVLLDVLGGIKITPIDASIEAQKRANEKRKEIESLRGQLRVIMLDKSLFPEEKQRQAEEVRDKIKTSVE